MGGILILDVREWDATAARKAREPLFRKRVETSRGRLTFTRAGFGSVVYFGAYDPDVSAGATDRIVAVATSMRSS